jgi:hypothetical protein
MDPGLPLSRHPPAMPFGRSREIGLDAGMISLSALTCTLTFIPLVLALLIFVRQTTVSRRHCSRDAPRRRCPAMVETLPRQ